MKCFCEPTYTVRLYMAGDLEIAKQFLRRECYRNGLCVTIESTSFIYTGGEESGFVVGFVNYPRFPTLPEQLFSRVKKIAEEMLVEMCQLSCLLVAPDVTHWLSLRKED